MATSNSGEVRFCDDCTARGNFLDEPGKARGSIVVREPRGFDQGDSPTEDDRVIVASLNIHSDLIRCL
ncbi:MAG TPA: hypothetical protein VMR34_04010 [Candidatus Saccharimonadales bacterium]|jgi:hypothetical protein|nr:hypothetical protein [Candidatus Saccharimonadales bacterium]